MNRTALIAIVALSGLGLGLLGLEARTRSEKNDRVKDVFATINKGIVMGRQILDERHYRAVAKTFVDPPAEWRHKNYGSGSCVHATTETLLEWQGLHDQAAEWRRRYSGGEATAQQSHTRKMDSMGLKYVTTTNGDTRLLEWACETRRGCGVAFPAGHCVALVGHEEGQAVLLDNNHVDHYDRIPWDEFVARWKRLGGLGFAFVYDAPPPTPRQ
jgi:hypothetical protein